MLRRLTRCSSLCGGEQRFPAAPREAGALRGGADAPSSALLPMCGPTRPTPGVPFVSRRKEPKACRGCAPGPPEGGTLSPLRRCRPPNRVSTTKIDRFATLSWWANRSLFFSSSSTGGHTLCFQPVARQVGLASACCRSGTPFWGERRLPPLGG